MKNWELQLTSKSTSHRFIVCALLLIFSCVFNLPGQPTQPARYEFEHKNNNHEFIIVSMGEKGLALVRDTEKFEGGKKDWEIIFVDTALHESGKVTMAIQQRFNIIGHEYHNGNVYLLFHEPNSDGRSINLAEISSTDYTGKWHSFKPDVSIRLTQFSVMETKAIFGGYINKEPALLMYDLVQKNAKIIPGIMEAGGELLDVRVNVNSTFNALVAESRSNKNKKLVIRTFDESGILLVDDAIVVDEGISIIGAITSTLVRDELAIIGTWTYGGSKQAAGIFSVLVDPFHEQKINYYAFPELNHFLDYLKPKRASKIKTKAQWRKSVGKQPEFRSHFSVIKIEETKNGFLFLGEVYSGSSVSNPRYSSQYGYPNGYGSPYGAYPYGFNTMPYRYYNSPYASPYGNPYGYSSSYSNDFEMISSSLLSFDGRAKLVSDQSMKLPEIKISSKEQVSDYIYSKGLITIACKGDKEITIKVNDPDGTIVSEGTIKPALKKPSEIIKSESKENSSIRAWYDGFFYVYGYQTIHDQSERNSRHVFYINKIKVN